MGKTVSGFFALLDIDTTDALSLFQLLTESGGLADLDAKKFVEGCLRFKGHARSIDLATFRQESHCEMTKLNNSLNQLNERLHAQDILVKQASSISNIELLQRATLTESARNAKLQLESG